MRRYPVSFLIALLLHAGFFLLLFLSWVNTPRPSPVVSVPVELVAKIPSRQQAEAPVDKLAVKAPAPIPAPEEQPKPVPPTPAPPLPVPVPQKEVAPAKKPEPKPKPPEPKPEPKPQPKVADKAPPDKTGTKKPALPEKTKPARPSAADQLLQNLTSQAAATPSKASARTSAQANTHRTTGLSNFGSGPADAGEKVALDAVTQRLQHLWSPNCDVPGGNQVQADIQFTLSPNGRVIDGPTWTNPRNDPVWKAGATRAMAAVKRGELYDGLPAGLYNVPITITFDAKSACRGQ